jgi:hypothetical protein
MGGMSFQNQDLISNIQNLKNAKMIPGLAKYCITLSSMQLCRSFRTPGQAIWHKIFTRQIKSNVRTSLLKGTHKINHMRLSDNLEIQQSCMACS